MQFVKSCGFDGNCQTPTKTKRIFQIEGNRTIHIQKEIAQLRKIEKPSERTIKQIGKLEDRLSIQVDNQYCPRVFKYMGDRKLLDQVFNL